VILLVSKEELINSLVQRSGLSESEINEKIDEKKRELSGVSDIGIINLVGMELNVNIQRPEFHELKIGNIVPNMFNITFTGKITQMSVLREFERDGSSGKVQNYIIEDETGRIRISLWNDEIDKYRLHIGDVITVDRCRTRKDNFGNAEARISYGGTISKVDREINVPVRETKTSLLEIDENDAISVEATLLHVFDRPLVYYFCPVCRAKIVGERCATHGVVQPTKTLIISGLIDDGNTTISAAFFGAIAENLLENHTETVEKDLKGKTVNDYIASLDILTKKFKINGSIRRNQFTNDLELRVNKIERL
jgi:replication factor A1